MVWAYSTHIIDNNLTKLIYKQVYFSYYIEDTFE